MLCAGASTGRGRGIRMKERWMPAIAGQNRLEIRSVARSPEVLPARPALPVRGEFRQDRRGGPAPPGMEPCHDRDEPRADRGGLSPRDRLSAGGCCRSHRRRAVERHLRCGSRRNARIEGAGGGARRVPDGRRRTDANRRCPDRARRMAAGIACGRWSRCRGRSPISVPRCRTCSRRSPAISSS